MKKTCAAMPIDTAWPVMLNSTRRRMWRRCSENSSAAAAVVSAPGPGPNSSVVAMKNVSSIAMFAVTDAKRSRKQPARIVSAGIATQPAPVGIRVAERPAGPSTSAPAAATANRYVRSAGEEAGRSPTFTGTTRLLRIGRRHAVAPEDRVVLGRVRVAPQNRLTARVVDLVAPQNRAA